MNLYSQHLVKVGFPILILLIYLSPLILLGQDAYILIHDNLDSNIAWFKVLAESDLIFAPSEKHIPNIFGGLPRVSLGTEFNLNLWLYILFPPYIAYVINLFAIHQLAFLGMYILLGRYFLNDTDKHFPLIRSGVALCFSLLPFWPSGGLSVAGLPIALYAFLNIRHRKDHYSDWLVICLLPFYSSLLASYLFFLIVLSCILIYDFIRGKRNFHFLFSMIIMSLIFVLVQYRLFQMLLFDSHFISHRSEFVISSYNFSAAISDGLKNFLNGQYHAHSLHNKYILPAVAVGLIASFAYRDHLKSIVLLLMMAFSISMIYGLWRWEGLNVIKENIFILRSVNFSRFHWLHPVIWYLLLALSLSVLSKIRIIGPPLVSILILFQISWLFYNSNFWSEYRTNRISFRAFYAEDQFHEISKFIGENENDFRVVSLGIHPSIAQYNNFFTLDGYVVNYPLYYKHQFREIIAGELKKNESLKEYYDNWGSRVYLFSSELRENGDYLANNSGNEFEISRLDISTQAFREMGGRYIISAVKINEENNPGITLLQIFINPESAWDIYLYGVNEIQ
ncbi:DUF6044 family protein [Desulfopila sp. IMCC35008]|uniref:DUF6044 family protein n=1 Tax=Desulfopila sp. IMCC35008 TaxID=2653858 RepID=UPI001F10434D|nr:DUF6044 family protein [Desulfopila sp. IMCC35008]